MASEGAYAPLLRAGHRKNGDLHGWEIAVSIMIPSSDHGVCNTMRREKFFTGVLGVKV